jgi:hypothetical protein
MSRTAASAVVLLALVLSGGAGGASNPWAKLYRPLHLPTLAPEAPCPISKAARFNFAKYGAARGIGPGPAYPVGGITQPGSVVLFEYPPNPYSLFADSDWSGQKVPWFVAPSYRGRVLIRGGRLDSPDTLRFNFGRVPSEEMRIPIGARGGGRPGWKNIGQRFRPAVTRLRAAGCYAYQIDGSTFSRIIVFRAVIEQ